MSPMMKGKYPVVPGQANRAMEDIAGPSLDEAVRVGALVLADALGWQGPPDGIHNRFDFAVREAITAALETGDIVTRLDCDWQRQRVDQLKEEYEDFIEKVSDELPGDVDGDYSVEHLIIEWVKESRLLNAENDGLREAAGGQGDGAPQELTRPDPTTTG